MSRVKMSPTFSVAAIVVLLLCATVTTANDNVRAAEEVARQGMKALLEGDIETLVDQMHPEAQEQFKALIWPVLAELSTLDTTGPTIQFIQFFGGELEDGKLVDKPADQFSRDVLTKLMRNVQGQLEFLDIELVGSIPEGDTLVHIVTRVWTRFQGVESVNLDLDSYKLYEGEWRCLNGDEFNEVAAGLHELAEDMKEASRVRE